MKTLRVSHCESTFTTPTGGPSGLVRYNNVFHNSKLLLRSYDRSTPAFHHSSRLHLAEAESPPHFFFSFRCNKPSSLCSSIVCIPLYFSHVLFWCIEVVWNSLFPCGKWLRRCHRALRHWWMVLFWTFNMLLGEVALVELFLISMF